MAGEEVLNSLANLILYFHHFELQYLQMVVFGMAMIAETQNQRQMNHIGKQKLKKIKPEINLSPRYYRKKDGKLFEYGNVP